MKFILKRSSDKVNVDGSNDHYKADKHLNIYFATQNVAWMQKTP